MAGPRVKVVHLITLLEFGGAQGNTLHTVKNLNEEKFETLLWSGKGAYWDEDTERNLGIHGRVRFFFSLVRPLNPFMDVIALFCLWGALLRAKPKILHTHSSKAGILGRIAGKLAGVPIIIHTFHGFGFNDQQRPWTRRFFIAVEKLTARFSTRLIFVSKSNMEEARRLRIGTPGKYQLIRSGVPLSKIVAEGKGIDRPTFLKEHGVPATARVVTTIGAFKPQKNLGDFIEMAKIISGELPDIYFFIIGDGGLRPKFERQVVDMGLKGRLFMPGWRRDATRFLAVSDIFVMTSLWEGLPRSLVEAMALGIPPVCYETDGVLDLLEAREGTMVPRGHVNQLTELVSDLLNNKEKRRHVSSLVKGRIGMEFDIDHMVRQQEDLYASLLQVDNPHRKH